MITQSPDIANSIVGAWNPDSAFAAR